VWPLYSIFVIETSILYTDMLELMCYMPVDSSFEGPYRMDFAETPALCIYYRDPYEGITTVILALVEYVKKNGIETTEPFLSIFLEGSP